MTFINLNGKILPSDAMLFSLNRAISYGDGLFESIRLMNGEILFYEDHIQRLIKSMQALKIEVPDYFSTFFFHKQIVDLLERNLIKSNARIRISVFRTGKGLYKPETNEAEFFIETLITDNGFVWNEDRCVLGTYDGIRKNFSSISFFKSMNALPYVMASIFSTENEFDDCILLNSAGNVTEATSSNIFWIENDKVFSPPVSDGSVDGVMRRNLIRIMTENGISFRQKSVTPEELKMADEIFLTNVACGIKPVSSFDSVELKREISAKLFKLIK